MTVPAAPSAFVDARALLRKHGLRPNRHLGQNFLVDRGALEAVIRAAGLEAQDCVLEVGAGVGTLTARLATQVRRVVAVELDQRLRPALEEVLGGNPRVRMVFGDILRLSLEDLTGAGPFRVVANIPYSITSALIRLLMEAPSPPGRVVLTLQEEVGERIVAGPGSMSLLALSVQLYGQPRLAARIPRGAFYPAPKVDSVVLRVDVHARPRVPAGLIERLFDLARAGFGQKRKMLRNALAGGLGVRPGEATAWLEAAGIAPSRRAEELSLQDWRRLAEARDSLSRPEMVSR
jgi:16S rRNA (adenine1518-N6/adenine1519-N6)-dimethyltransferase